MSSFHPFASSLSSITLLELFAKLIQILIRLQLRLRDPAHTLELGILFLRAKVFDVVRLAHKQEELLVAGPHAVFFANLHLGLRAESDHTGGLLLLLFHLFGIFVRFSAPSTATRFSRALLID